MKRFWRYMLVLISGGCVAFLLLCGICLIPQDVIQQNALNSAKYLSSKDDIFKPIIGNMSPSKADYYADSISVSIAYGLGDEENILQKVAETKYFDREKKSSNDSLYAQIYNREKANQEYVRYWHGSTVLIRLLLVVTDIKGMYIIGAITLIGLFALLVWQLVRKEEKVFAIAISLTFVLIWGFLAPISLEYLWTFLIAISALIILRKIYQKDRVVIPLFFMIVGMLTNYFDFLTAETLTLTLPLLLIIWLERKYITKKRWKERSKVYVGYGICWLLGYIGLWLMKWMFAAVVLKIDIWPLVGGHIAERSIGGFSNSGPIIIFLSGLIRNIGCIMPFCFGLLGAIASIIVGMILLYIGIVYRKRKCNKYLLITLLLIGMVPIVRMIILSNHIYLHFFFTYRALGALILAGILALSEVIDKELIKIR